MPRRLLQTGQWNENMWAEDARPMADLGLKYVRVGAFAWPPSNPLPGRWPGRAFATLSEAVSQDREGDTDRDGCMRLTGSRSGTKQRGCTRSNRKGDASAT